MNGSGITIKGLKKRGRKRKKNSDQINQNGNRKTGEMYTGIAQKKRW